ncbi:MAG: helix-turn-helix transcriptional regulator [Sulfurimonas sp.]|nr:helix-turn-helix transcriptional regulator [Sulfurimonas sp.]
MDKINTKKVKDLIKENGLKNVSLANHLGISPSGLSDSLNGKRPLSMNYIFDLANFFNVDAKSLTIENDTSKPTCQANTKDKEKAS